jgi:hypothetical protein
VRVRLCACAFVSVRMCVCVCVCVCVFKEREHKNNNHAAQALSCGLINKVVPADQLRSTTQALAHKIAQVRPPIINKAPHPHPHQSGAVHARGHLGRDRQRWTRTRYQLPCAYLSTLLSLPCFLLLSHFHSLSPSRCGVMVYHAFTMSLDLSRSLARALLRALSHSLSLARMRTRARLSGSWRDSANRQEGLLHASCHAEPRQRIRLRATSHGLFPSTQVLLVASQRDRSEAREQTPLSTHPGPSPPLHPYPRSIFLRQTFT